MSAALTNVWRQLMQRRLWPVAIILVAALAAVPMLLAKEPESSADPAPVAQAGDDDDNILASQPIVSAATAADFAARRHVLGDKKNPFHVEKPKKDETAKESSSDTNPAPGQDGGDGGTSGSSTDAPSGGGGVLVPPGTGVTPGVPVDPPARTYDKYDLTVRFGDSSGELQRMTLPRLQPLPREELPVLIYLGVSKDGKSAMFLLEKGVEAVGDGDCDPTPEDCETLRLRAGETEFFDVTDEEGNVSEQYQLDLIEIHKGSTASAAKASASSKAGRKLLSARVDASAAVPYRFDADTGTVVRQASARATGNVAQGAASLR